MKRFEVSEKCNSCGLCTVSSEFLKEDEEGRAVPIPGKLIKGNEEKKAAALVENCPVKALSLIDIKALGTKSDVVKRAEEKLLAIAEMSEPPLSDFRFENSEYSLPEPVASGEYRYDYSSYGSAKNAAEREIDNKMYSKIKPMLMKLVMQYKTKYLYKYYSEDGNNVFDQKNSEIEIVLKEIAGEYESVTGESLNTDFTLFRAYPDSDRNSMLGLLRRNEIFSDEVVDAIKREFDSSSYSSLSSYVDYCDIDDEEKYVGKGAFGKDKYKTMYCYRHMDSAFREIAKDLISSAGYSDLNERAQYNANSIIWSYNNNMKKEIAEKIKYLKSL